MTDAEAVISKFDRHGDVSSGDVVVLIDEIRRLRDLAIQHEARADEAEARLRKLGFLKDKQNSCKRCDGKGWIHGLNGPKGCPRCNGSVEDTK